MSDLNDMMVFRSVVDQGSFTATAKAMGLPKSNISRKISRLETQLGVRLLQRSTRSLHLTEIGRTYYEHCVRIHEEMLNADNCVEAMAALPQGWIKLCTSISIGQALLLPRLAQFDALYPDVHLDLRLNNRRVDVIEEGFDMVIRVGESPDSTLISQKLYNVTLHLFASPEYLSSSVQANSQPLRSPTDLQHYQCLFMSAMGERPRWELSVGNKKIPIDFKPAFISDDFNVLYQMALAGRGITLLPDYLCAQADRSNELVRVLPEWLGKAVNIYAIYPSRNGVTPKLRVLIDFLLSCDGERFGCV